MNITLQQVQTLVTADDGARLAHALRLARGFALFFVRCNVPLYRSEVVARLREGLPRPIVEVDLTGEMEVYPAIARAAESAPEESVLFIYGLEAHLPSADRERALQTLRNLNWRRAAFQRLARPLVFWLPEYALNLLAQEAPDFYDWNSGVFELPVPEMVWETLLAALEVSEARDFPSLPVTEKESRIHLLEDLWEEYEERHPAEQQARLQLDLQLGELYSSLGQYDAAQHWLTEAQRLAESLGDLRGRAATLREMAYIHRVRGNPEGAMRLLRESLAIQESLGDLRGKAATLHEMAGIHRLQGDLEGAMRLLRESLAIRESLSDLRGKGATLRDMAEILAAKGDLEGAMRLLRESLAIQESLGDLRGKAATLHAIAGILAAQGDLEGAMRLLRESLAIQESLGDLRGKAATLTLVGQVSLVRSQPREGQRALQEAVEVLSRVGARADAERVAGILDWAHRILEAGAESGHE